MTMGLFDFLDHKNEETLVKEAEYIYQLKEYGGEIWLTFGGSLVCPSPMLSDDPVDAVRKMRELYVQRHK